MDCDSAREAISARIDGEDPGPPGDGVDEHLANCAACRAWQQRAHAVTRRARLGGAFLEHDLASAVLAAVPVPGPRRRRRLAPRLALIVLALGQLAIAVPMLFGHDHDAGVHAAHELGSFNLALAIAFAVGAVRPALSGGLAWPCAISAVGLVTTAIADLIGGQAIGADEAQHLVALAGAALLVWQSRTAGARTASPAAAVPVAEDLARPARAGLEAMTWADASPERPFGGDAARLTGPGVAAQAADQPADSARPQRAGRSRGESVA